MNIANIFGLHLGCMVKDIETGEIGCLKGIISHEEMTGGFYLICGENTIPIGYCKLILKPLSAMSDEDKREFLNKFYPNKTGIYHFGCGSEGAFVVIISDNGELESCALFK